MLIRLLDTVPWRRGGDALVGECCGALAAWRRGGDALVGECCGALAA
jgi:hypothetical protein